MTIFYIQSNFYFLGGSRAIRYTPRACTPTTLLRGAAPIPAALQHEVHRCIHFLSNFHKFQSYL
jgi:hypothetical protein